MAPTEAQKRARDKWLSEKVETIAVRVPKGKKEVIKKYAADHGESTNAFINRVIDEAMEDQLSDNYR